MNSTSGGGSSSVLRRTSQPSLMRWTSSMMKTLRLRSAGGGVDARQQLAHVVDAVVARGVELDDVERPPLADGDAVGAGVVRLAVDGVGAVDCLGHDPRGERLARAARADEEQAVAQPIEPDGVAQRLDDRVLGNDVGERLRAPAPIERLVRRWGWRLVWATDGSLEPSAQSRPVTNHVGISPLPLSSTRPRGSRREACHPARPRPAARPGCDPAATSTRAGWRR